MSGGVTGKAGDGLPMSIFTPNAIKEIVIVTATQIAKGLHGHKTPSGWMANCPAHDDRNPSLSIRERDGKVLVHCHAGCDQRSVIAALKALGLWSEGEGRIYMSNVRNVLNVINVLHVRSYSPHVGNGLARPGMQRARFPDLPADIMDIADIPDARTFRGLCRSQVARPRDNA